MHKKCLLILIVMLSVALAGCSVERPESDVVMTKGDLVYLNRVTDGFEFAFLTKENILIDNIQYRKNYTFKIDNSVKEPELYYGVLTRSFKGNVTESNNIDSNTKIEILINQNDYKKLVSAD